LIEDGDEGNGRKGQGEGIVGAKIGSREERSKGRR